MAVQANTEVTTLLHGRHLSDRDAQSELLDSVYGELRRTAAHYLAGERARHSWQPSDLVHEAVLRLLAHDIGGLSRSQVLPARGHLPEKMAAKRDEKR